MNDPKLIEKIQKMLELGRRGGSESEMETAMRMVHELLAKYNLTIADVKAPQEEAAVQDETSRSGQRIEVWQQSIWQSISSLYFCFHYIDRGSPHLQHVLIGRPSNVVVAKDMIAYIIATGKRLAVSYPTVKARNSFKKGFAFRIAERAGAELQRAKANKLTDASGTALILAPIYEQAEREARALLESKGIKIKVSTSQVSTGDAHAFHSGREAANKVSLQANGVGGSAAPVGMLGREVGKDR